MKKTGENSPKTGVNGFSPKTESESRGLPLMNGGLKKALKTLKQSNNILDLFVKDHLQPHND